MQPAIILMLLVPLLGRTQAPKISLIKSILLPGVKGKFDHIAIDNVSQNLFLTAKGINSVEIIDLVRGKITHSIKSVSAPQGLLYIPGKKLLLVCGGGTKIYKSSGRRSRQYPVFTCHENDLCCLRERCISSY